MLYVLRQEPKKGEWIRFLSNGKIGYGQER